MTMHTLRSPSSPHLFPPPRQAAIRRKVDDLLYRVYLPREQLLRLVVRCPALLMMSARTVQAKIEGLQVGGGESRHAVIDLSASTLVEAGAACVQGVQCARDTAAPWGAVEALWDVHHAHP